MIESEILQACSQPHLLGRMFGFNDLTELHSSWILSWLHCRDEHALQAHRNAYKTSSLAVLIVLILLTDPNATILIMRKAHAAAVQLAEQVRRLLESSVGKCLFTVVHGAPARDNRDWGRERFTIRQRGDNGQKEPSVRASGLRVHTGDHYKWIIADDIIDMLDRDSDAECERTKEVVRELYNIRAPGGRILWVGTPWREDDAWSILPEPDKYPAETTGLIAPDELERLRSRMPTSHYAANYSLKHVADEDLPLRNLVWGIAPRVGLTWTLYVDPAYEGKCHTAIVGAARHGDKIYLAGMSRRKSVDDMYEDFCSFIARFPRVRMMWFEKNADHGLSARAFKAYLKRKIDASGRPLPPSVAAIERVAVNAHAQTADKHIRILVTLKRYWPDLVFDEELFEAAAAKQVSGYSRSSALVDVPDALAGVLSKLTSGKGNYGGYDPLTGKGVAA